MPARPNRCNAWFGMSHNQRAPLWRRLKRRQPDTTGLPLYFSYSIILNRSRKNRTVYGALESLADCELLDDMDSRGSEPHGLVPADAAGFQGKR